MSRNKAKGRGWLRATRSTRQEVRAARRAQARYNGVLRLAQLTRPGYGFRVSSLSERSRRGR